jgi:type I restriction enzyme M protein
MDSLFPELDLEEACFALRTGREQEGITRIYAILWQHLQGNKPGIGLYPTPISLARFMVEIAQPEPGETICDPACGLGSFFIEAHRYLKDHYGSDTSNTFLGYDINSRLLEIGKVWMEANGINTSHIRERDVLMPNLFDGGDDDSPEFKRKYLILTHPPYEQIADQSEKSSPRVFNESADYYYRKYLHHCMEILQKHSDGRCGIIVPQNFFRNPSTKEQRCDLFNEYNIRLLVRLPEKMFTSVSYYSYLLYFDNHGTTGQILRCNIREDEAPVPSRSRQSSDGVSFKEAENIWERWREQSSVKPFILTDEEQKYVWIIDAETVRKQDEDCTLIDYVPPRPEEKHAPSLDELMERLVEEAGELYGLVKQLQKRIKEGV